MTEKKEIGKLLELLNEYNKSQLNEFEEYEEWWYCKWNGKILKGNWENNNELTPYELYSKQFGFIEWLFDKNKIDWSKFHKYSFYKKDNKFIQYYDLQSLLMALSISDTPIEDLCGYLKDDATEKVDTLLKGIKKSCESLGI